jgi:hypothetical protein
MPTPFHCPVCGKVLAGQDATCLTCQPNPTAPETPTQAPAPPNGRWRSHQLLLAGVLLALVFGLGAFAGAAFLAKDSRTSPVPAESKSVAITPEDVLPSKEQPAAPIPEKKASAPAKSEPAQPPGPTRVASLDRAKPSDGRSILRTAPAAPNPVPTAAKLPTANPEKDVPQSLRARWTSKRRSRLSDEELRLQLVQAPEVDLDSVPGTTQRVIYRSSKTAGSGIDLIPQFAPQRADLLGLPFHQGLLAHLNTEEALNLKVLSQRLRLEVQGAMRGNLGSVVDPRPDPDLLRQRLIASPLRDLWLRPQAIGTLRQLLMPEHRNVRLILVELLARIDGPLASMVLAERAVFDLDPDVRLAALLALKDRPSREYVGALIAALRYPWPAFADHAAEALVALQLKDAVPKLIPLLDARDQGEPYVAYVGKTRRLVVPELVRVNHLHNCLLCHAYSGSPLDPVRGLAPNAEHLVPLPSSGARTGGWGGGGGGGGSSVSVITPTFVRADTNFLRQDFSVVQPVPNHGRLWPSDQRYDYLVRLRPLSPRELLVWQQRIQDLVPAQPQREALLFALRELTGESPGDKPEAWKRLYSTITGEHFAQPQEPPDQVQHLRDTLVKATPARQSELLALFRERRGDAYDNALALALPQLSPALQKSARAVLVDRLYALPVKGLRAKLADKEREMQSATLTVCKQRKLKVLTPELIALLEAPNPAIAEQSRELLQQFASRNLGPRVGATPEQRREAVGAWRAWWDKENEKLAARKRPS